MGPSI